MAVAAENRGSTDWVEVIINYEFEVEQRLALAWVAELIARPLNDVTPAQYANLLVAYIDLAGACPDVPRDRLPAQLPARGRALLQSAAREATIRNPKWAEIEASDSGYAVRIPGWSDWWREIKDALVGETNKWGTGAQTLMLLDSLVRTGLPVSWLVRAQGGKWELYDANANARKHARGKAAKAALKPRMVLRARGVRMPFKFSGAWASSGAVKVSAPGARTVAEALKISRAGAMKWVSKSAYGALPLRGLLGGNLVGVALSIGPQAYKDAQDTKLLENLDSKEAWTDFAIAEAKGQSGNVAGILGGMALGAVAVAFGVTAAPALLFVGLLGGIGAQAGFSAFGLNDHAEDLAKWIFGR